jgi:uncharacterized protein YlxP (DUF503 family)
MVGVLNIHLHLPGCASLKEKRGRLQPLLHRLRREFNLSVAEVGRQDAWQEAVICCAMVGNEGAFLNTALSSVVKWVYANWPDGMVLEESLEIL